MGNAEWSACNSELESAGLSTGPLRPFKQRMLSLVCTPLYPTYVPCPQDAWLGVYDAAVEAIFLCYLVDQEENDGVTRPYYASAALRSYMEMHRPCYQLPESTPPSTT